MFQRQTADISSSKVCGPEAKNEEQGQRMVILNFIDKRVVGNDIFFVESLDLKVKKIWSREKEKEKKKLIAFTGLRSGIK